MTTTTINYTGKAELDLLIVDVNSAFAAKDKTAMIAALTKVLEETVKGGEVADWITEPQVFVQLKEGFVSEFTMEPRIMQLKNRVPHRHRRAIMFAKMFLNAVQRVNE